MFKKLNIIDDKNPLIRKKSEDVELPLSDKDKSLALDMLEYIKESQKEEIQKKYDIRSGVGLSAVQVGVLKRIIAIFFEDEDGAHEYLMANPIITSESVRPSFLGPGEACLSVPNDVEGLVYRHSKITVKFFDILKGEPATVRVSGFEAIVFQHELDHLEGILYYDRINKKDPFIRIKDAIEI